MPSVIVHGPRKILGCSPKPPGDANSIEGTNTSPTCPWEGKTGRRRRKVGYYRAPPRPIAAPPANPSQPYYPSRKKKMSEGRVWLDMEYQPIGYGYLAVQPIRVTPKSHQPIQSLDLTLLESDWLRTDQLRAEAVPPVNTTTNTTLLSQHPTGVVMYFINLLTL